MPRSGYLALHGVNPNLKKKPTQSHSLEKHMTLAKISLYCILNLSYCLLAFCFQFFAWLIKLKCTPCPSLGGPKLEGGPDLKGGTQIPFHAMMKVL